MRPFVTIFFLVDQFVDFFVVIDLPEGTTTASSLSNNVLS
jgi:hypothetical protein